LDAGYEELNKADASSNVRYMKQALDRLKAHKPSEQQNAPVEDSECERVSELMQQLAPDLEGTSDSWFSAVFKLTGPVRQIKVKKEAVFIARAELDAWQQELRQSQDGALSDLIVQCEGVCQSMQDCVDEHTQDADRVQDKLKRWRELEHRHSVYTLAVSRMQRGTAIS